MSGWAARRFWQEVTVEPVEGGWSVRLDARLLRTPAKAPRITSPSYPAKDKVSASTP